MPLSPPGLNGDVDEASKLFSVFVGKMMRAPFKRGGVLIDCRSFLAGTVPGKTR